MKNNSYNKDIICARATPPGASAIAVIRVSGNNSWSLLKSIFISDKKNLSFSTHRIYYGKLKEKNAEVRREIVKKIGIENVYKKLPVTIIESSDVYDLINIDLQDGRIRPYLKMINPSTGDLHIEGVHPSCTTIHGALAWRNGINGEWIEPETLT